MNSKEKINFFNDYYIALNSPTNEAFGNLLKRKRQEQNKTLEDVSSGICSVSYLSRIENNQVAVDEFFYNHLFERLDLNYENVKRELRVNILLELSRMLLEDKTDSFNDIATSAIRSNTYSIIEQELIKLMKAINDLDLDECVYLLEILDDKINKFTTFEVTLYNYLSAKAEYLLNNKAYAYHLLECMFSVDVKGRILKQLIGNLMLEAFCYFDDDWRFIFIYNSLKSDGYHNQARKQLLINDLEYYYMIGKNNYQKAKTLFDNFYDDYLFKGDNEELYQQYGFYKVKLELYHNHYNLASNELYSMDINHHNVILLNNLINISDDRKIAYDNIYRLKEVKFTKFDKIISKYTKYTIDKIDGVDNSNLIDYLKTELLTNIDDDSYRNSFLYQPIFNELDKGLFSLGKYKEIARKQINHQKR